MPPWEMASRARRTAIHRWDDLTWRLSRDTWKANWTPPHALARVDAPTESVGLLTVERARVLRSASPSEAAAIIEAADRFIDGRISFFGYPEVRLPTPIDYSYDPFAKVRWPSRHGKHIDYRHIGDGDPKWIWS